MRRDRLIRNIRRLLCTAIIPVLFVGCAQPEPPPADPVELELAGLTVHQRAALAVASAFPPPDGAGADQLWAELATGAAGAVVIAASRLPEAAALLDSLRSTAPLPILVVVEVDQVLPGAQLCRPGRGDGSAALTRCPPPAADSSPALGMTRGTSREVVAVAETGTRAGAEVGRAVFAAGGDLALVALPPINRDDPLGAGRPADSVTSSPIGPYLEGLREAGLRLAVRALTVDDTLSAPLRWDRARLEAIELPELARVVEGEVSAIELGGVSLPSLTGDSLPLPLSAAAVDGLLRRDLGFAGVVMGDLSEGSYAARKRGMPEAAVEALSAGVDLLLGVEAPAAAVDAIAAAVTAGRLPPERLEAAARRVLRLRRAAGLGDSLRLERRRIARAALTSAGTTSLSASADPPVVDSAGQPVEALTGTSPPAPTLRVVPPDSVGMAATVRTRIDAVMREALEDSVFSGAAVAVGRRGGLVLLRGYGRSGRSGGGGAVDPSTTIFDLASLTKVIGTTTAAALLVDDGRLELDAPLDRYLPEFDGDGKEDVLIRHLLSHTSGLPSGIWVFGSANSPDEALRQILQQPLVREPGERMEYSDLGMILLAEAVERAAERPIDHLLARRVFAPLGMQSTMYLPPLLLHDGIVPTAELTERDFPLQGIVHDANSFRLGGIAGHAGLFSTARDLAVFAQMMLNGGRYGARSILSAETVDTFTRRQPGAEQRALGWDTPSRVSSAGAYFSARSFGHTGYTGTSLWMDPQSGLFVVLLTNRTYVKASARDILRLRAAVHDAAARAITDQPVRPR